MKNFGRLVDALAPISGDAVDAVQDAFIEAHLHWATVSSLDNPYAWVRRVAIRKLQDRHRRQLTHGRLLESLSILRQDVSPEDSRNLDLTKAISGLPMRQRLAVALFYLEDMSIEDISTATGISEGAIKSALYDGRRRLKRIMGAEDSELFEGDEVVPQQLRQFSAPLPSSHLDLRAHWVTHVQRVGALDAERVVTSRIKHGTVTLWEAFGGGGVFRCGHSAAGRLFGSRLTSGQPKQYGSQSHREGSRCRLGESRRRFPAAHLAS